MKLTVLNTALISLLIIGAVQCTSSAEVQEERVADIIETLSSDDMRGRSAFNDDIDKAARFIEAQFEKIDLEKIENEESYRQNFTVYSIKPGQGNIVLNGEEIDSKRYFVRTYLSHIEWNQNDVEVFHIAKDDTLREKIRNFLSDSVSSVVLVDEKHHEWFYRYRRYFERPNYSIEPYSETNDVFILYSGTKPRSFLIQFQNDADSLELFNIAGKIEGKRSDEIVLFSAHYDHVGITTPVDGDSIANGANDNATGVAAVIEIARYYKALGIPERTLYFVTFTAEEIGGYGSEYFSRQLNPDQIVAMFNIEMIGKPAVEGPNTAWITGYNYSDLGQILQSSLEDSSFIFYPDPYPNQNLFYRSDNATLARLGVPAHSFSTTPIDVDEDYHRVSDEFHTIDISHTTKTISAIAKASRVIVSGEKTPVRINTDEID